MEPSANNVPVDCSSCRSHSCSPFAELPPLELVHLAGAGKALRFGAGDVLPSVRNGQSGFYCVQSGHLKVEVGSSDRKRAIGIYGPGQFVAFGGQMPEQTRTLTALGEGSACFISDAAFMDLFKQSSRAQESLLNVLLKEIRDSETRIAGLENHYAKGRVCAVLLRLSNKFGVAQGAEISLGIKIDRNTMAQLSGTVPETLARVLTELEKDEIVRRAGRALIVRNRAALEKLAQG